MAGKIDGGKHRVITTNLSIAKHGNAKTMAALVAGDRIGVTKYLSVN